MAKGGATAKWPCGHPRSPGNTQRIGEAGVRCRQCRRRIAYRYNERLRAQRNAAILNDYACLTRAQLADKYGLAPKTIETILYRAGIRLPDDERQRRLSLPCKRYRGGRPRVWPDCPAHLRAEYRRLRVTYGYRAAEARRMLEAQA